MRENTIQILFSILSAELKGKVLSENEKVLCTDEVVLEVLNIAQKHDIAHLICTSLLENKLLPDNASKYQSFLYKAIYRYEKQNYELNRILELLNRIGVPFILLKGSVLRQFYKSPWLRTSCDIDILVKKDDLSQAQNAIIKELEYERKGNSTHDISFFSSGGVCLELHFELKEPNFRDSPLLTDVWNSTEITQISDFEYGMSNELFLFYHIYHMAKHFIHGGCGIKALIDLWVIKNKIGYDEYKARKLLRDNELLDFYIKSVYLTKVWFEGLEHDDISLQMEKYIIRGGVYGTSENRITVQQQKKGGKFKYALSRIFIPYNELKFYYPILQKHKWMTPFMEVRRWFKLVFCGGARRSLNELKYNASISATEASETKKFLSDIGL